jgi:hypothetical protein
MCSEDFDLDDVRRARRFHAPSFFPVHPVLIREFVEKQRKRVAA